MTATYEVTTTGLQDPGVTAASLPAINWAVAAGTADAVTAAYTPANTALTDGLVLGFRASAANITATPTFAPDGLTAHTIVADGVGALLPGDIPGANAEMLVRYRLSTTKWELLNPAYSPRPGTAWVAGGGAADAITATFSPAVLALTDGLLLAFRATAANATTTPTFSPNGLTARTITFAGGMALNAGAIPGNLAEMLVRYNLANTRWELLNPAVVNASMVMAGEVFKVLTADDTGGTNVATAQPWFPTAGSVVVAAGTAYQFNGLLWLSRSAGTTSHTTGTLFGGTATLSSAVYAVDTMIGDVNALVALNTILAVDGTLAVGKVASTSATEQVILQVRGIIRVNAGGTLIPQFKYSVAPGGTPTVKAGSFFRAYPISNPQGTWA